LRRCGKRAYKVGDISGDPAIWPIPWKAIAFRISPSGFRHLPWIEPNRRMLAILFPAIDPVAIQIGPLAIRWYALAYLIGFVAGWRYCIGLAHKDDRPPTAVDFDDFLTWAVIGVILAHVATAIGLFSTSISWRAPAVVLGLLLLMLLLY